MEKLDKRMRASVFRSYLYISDAYTSSLIWYTALPLRMESTPIRIKKETRESLMKFRSHPRETYDEVITRLMESQTDTSLVSEETLQAIEEGLSDIRNKKTRELNEFCDSHGI
jgi:hypothetical protein